MEMPEDMKLRADRQNSAPEHFTAAMVKTDAVETKMRRPVSHQYIGSHRYLRPVTGDIGAALTIEGQAEEPRLHGRSPEPQPADF